MKRQTKQQQAANDNNRELYAIGIEIYNGLWDRACDQSAEDFEAFERANKGDLVAIDQCLDAAVVAAIAEDYAAAVEQMRSAIAILGDCLEAWDPDL